MRTNADIGRPVLIYGFATCDAGIAGSVICIAPQEQIDGRDAALWHDGQISKIVSSPLAKNFLLLIRGKSLAYPLLSRS
jgi:hypothetical protein